MDDTTPTPAQHVGARIRAHRVAQGLSLRDLAERAYGKKGPGGYLCRLEGGYFNPRSDTVELIATRGLGLRNGAALWDEPATPALAAA